MATCEIFNETDIGILAGSTEVIKVNLYNILGSALHGVDIESVEWKMSKYGEIECLISKDLNSGISQQDNEIIVTIFSTDTQNLYGKFTHQLSIVDTKQSKYIADLGKISIKPLIR